jgi:Transglycosylase SLT domain
MSKDKIMKPRQKAKKVELSWIQAKLYHISVLYLVMSVVLVGVFAVSVRYEVAPKKLIFEQADAASKPKEAPVEITTCEEAIKVYSKQYGVSEDLMVRIMESESGDDHTAENGVSTATGCFQWVIGSWRSYGKKLWGDDFYQKNVYSPKDNTELAAWTISKYGTSPWDASKHAWGR